MAYLSNDRIKSWFWLFGVEGPATMSAMYYLYGNTTKCCCPSSDVERFLWVAKHLCAVVAPTFLFLWGAMRAFDSDVKAEDPFAGVETARWKTFQNIDQQHRANHVIYSVDNILSFTCSS